MEKLFRLKWGRLDGLGALIISPTRELAMQIFDELRKVGARHDLSAGLLIGGKNVKEERERINGERSPLAVLQNGRHPFVSQQMLCPDSLATGVVLTGVTAAANGTLYRRLLVSPSLLPRQMTVLCQASCSVPQGAGCSQASPIQHTAALSLLMVPF